MNKKIKRDKFAEIQKLNKSNNVKKFFIVAASCLSVALIIFLIAGCTCQAMGVDEMSFFVTSLDGDGKLFANINSITILGWVALSISIVTIAFDVTALVIGIVFRSSGSIIKEVKKAYSLE